MNEKTKNKLILYGVYYSWSIIWIFGLSLLVLMGYYLGYQKAHYPDIIWSPFDDIIIKYSPTEYINLEYMNIYEIKPKFEIIMVQIMKFQTILAVLSLVIIETSSRIMYKTLFQLNEKRKYTIFNIHKFLKEKLKEELK